MRVDGGLGGGAGGVPESRCGGWLGVHARFGGVRCMGWQMSRVAVVRSFVLGFVRGAAGRNAVAVSVVLVSWPQRDWWHRVAGIACGNFFFAGTWAAAGFWEAAIAAPRVFSTVVQSI